MDPIELARQHARRLHDEAVQRGRNPWSPYEFAVGVANDLGITVETCAPGAAMLDGGRASLIQTSRSSSMRSMAHLSTKHSWLRMKSGTPNWAMEKRHPSQRPTLTQLVPRKLLQSGWIGSSTTAADSVEKSKWTSLPGSFSYRGL